MSTTTTTIAASTRRPRYFGIILAWVLGLMFLAFVAARLFVVDYLHVPSDSMYPTVPNGSVVIIDKRGFGNIGPLRELKRTPTAAIARADLVAFYVGDDRTIYLKRVIGLPGEHVTLKGRQLTINGAAVPVRVAPVPLAQAGPFEYQLAIESIGDQEIEIAWLPSRFAPDFDGVVPADHYFVLGDNRDNARDSRYQDVGFIPKQAIMGRVVKVMPPER